MDSIDHFLLFAVTPTVFALSLIEAVVLARRQRYDWGAFAASAFDLVARIAVGILLPLSIAAPLVVWAVQHRVATWTLDGPLALALLFFGQELCYYAYHRAAHRVRWFWCNHAVHHSPNELNLSAAYRIGMFGKLSGTTLFFVPLIWLGFPPKLVLQTLTFNLLYQFWLHTTWIPKLGWLEGIVNTPSAHRVHHGANPEYLDANYGGVLMLFDRLFGTYRAERDDVPVRYGLVQPLRTSNPLKIEFHEWARLAGDLWRARSLRAAWAALFLPPGWRADAAVPSAELPARAEGVDVPQAPKAPRRESGKGLRLVSYRPLFSGPAVERIPELQFQRPGSEIELSAADAAKIGAGAGSTVRVSSNGTSVELRARVNKNLVRGVARIPVEHAQGLGTHVEVST